MVTDYDTQGRALYSNLKVLHNRKKRDCGVDSNVKIVSSSRGMRGLNKKKNPDIGLGQSSPDAESVVNLAFLLVTYPSEVSRLRMNEGISKRTLSQAL